MIEAMRTVRVRQRQSGIDLTFVTVSNCLVNMVSPAQYNELPLPLDLRIAKTADCIGIHNCAWNADPYLDYYATIPRVGYIDMGLDSNLARGRHLFPGARRALMYTPMALANKPLHAIESDLQRIARDYAPCDVVFADIEAGTSDDRVLEVVELCGKLEHRESHGGTSSIQML